MKEKCCHNYMTYRCFGNISFDNGYISLAKIQQLNLVPREKLNIPIFSLSFLLLHNKDRKQILSLLFYFTKKKKKKEKGGIKQLYKIHI